MLKIIQVFNQYRNLSHTLLIVPPNPQNKQNNNNSSHFEYHSSVLYSIEQGKVQEKLCDVITHDMWHHLRTKLYSIDNIIVSSFSSTLSSQEVLTMFSKLVPKFFILNDQQLWPIQCLNYKRLTNYYMYIVNRFCLLFLLTPSQ